MLRRKETTRSKRMNDQAMQALRETIVAGTPWTRAQTERARGWFDIRGLITGHFFEICLDYCRQDDEESQRGLWLELRDDILPGHIQHQPGSRPWGMVEIRGA
jgi:hypothetical protein